MYAALLTPQHLTLNVFRAVHIRKMRRPGVSLVLVQTRAFAVPLLNHSAQIKNLSLTLIRFSDNIRGTQAG
jgi:hypothetical protein